MGGRNQNDVSLSFRGEAKSKTNLRQLLAHPRSTRLAYRRRRKSKCRGWPGASRRTKEENQKWEETRRGRTRRLTELSVVADLGRGSEKGVHKEEIMMSIFERKATGQKGRRRKEEREREDEEESFGLTIMTRDEPSQHCGIREPVRDRPNHVRESYD